MDNDFIDTENIEDAEDFNLDTADERTVLDNFGAEELGIALGFGEEIGLDAEEEARAKRDNKRETISLKEHNALGRGRRGKKRLSAAMFENWVEGVINGSIDPDDPYPPLYLPDPVLDDPM